MKNIADGKKWKSFFLYGIVAVLVFECLWVATFRDRRSHVKDETEVRIMVMGDSIFGESRDETSVSARLGEALGEYVFNGSLSGTTMARIDTNDDLGYTKDCLSMQAYALSVATKDFGPQQTFFAREAATDYFSVAINMIETVDFDNLEVLFIEHGINDYHAGVPIENPEDAYDVYTFTGALRSTIQTLKKAYPDLQIVLVTPTYSWYFTDTSNQMTCEEYNLGGGVLEEYVNAELEVAREMNVDVIDHYHNFYPHEQEDDWKIYTRDGLHPNEEGCKLIAMSLYQYLQNS